MTFRPNLSDREPPVISEETSWLARMGGFFVRHGLRLTTHDRVVQSRKV
jgi:hypothetical protein